MIKPEFNRTKIVATIGPACSDKAVLERMIAKGVDVCRVNFSHGTHEEHKKVINTIREINKENNLHICILGDLQGPKLRVGKMAPNSILKEGQVYTLTNKKQEGTSEVAYINYTQLPHDAKVGDRILLDDGKLEMEVIESNNDDTVKAKVIYGGELKSNKGVNLPNTNISLPSLTDKDLRDLEFALENNLEWIALSFVRKAEDIEKLKGIISNKGKFSKVIAKIEKPEAIKNIDAIITATDGIMIARGDLGVEIPMEELPIIQKSIVKKCIRNAKPSIIATQMMESMIENPRPTRAESNDVANGVLDGSDAVMLSGETSVGKFPVQVIESMGKIISQVEEQSSIYEVDNKLNPESPTYYSDALCKNAVQLGHEINANGVIGMTKSGYTGFQLSSHRPKAYIYIFSSNTILLNTMNLLWGVRGFYYDKFISTDQTFEDVINILKKKNFVQIGDIVLNTASMPIHEKTRTNMIKISQVK